MFITSLRYITFVILCMLMGANSELKAQEDPFDPFDKVLNYENPKLKNVLANPDKFELQIIYTEINRNKDNEPIFSSFHFRSNEDVYFYPASTVKMPTAFVALEKLNELNIQGLTRDSYMKIKAGISPQTDALVDSSSESGLPSLAHYIKKLFVVSDNDAYNRLYEFCGQQYLNERLHEKGFKDSHIIHRLSAPQFDQVSNQYTNPILFYNEENPLYYQGPVYSTFDHHINVDGLQRIKKGKGYMDRSGKLVEESMDFSSKNYISLQTLNELLKTVLFPESVPSKNRFRFSEEDYRFLYRCMSTYPEESDFPDYKDGKHPDGYVKFFMFGDTIQSVPSNIRIFNKVGYAYGYLTDVAYIVDFEKDVEFMLAATIHVNENMIYNDGIYEYEEIGLPFLSELGNLFYQYECERERNYIPDLNKFKMESYH